MSPVKNDRKTGWVNEVWKYILSREHGLPFKEPEWFYWPAFAQLPTSKPLIYNTLNRDRNLPYEKQVKPFNFLLVAYPVEDKIFGTNVVTKYYCKKYKAIGQGLCKNKSRCEYGTNCYANLHIIPIAPFNNLKNWDQFEWLDKNTKEQVKIRLSNSRSEEFKKAEIERQLDRFLPGKDLKGRKKYRKLLVKGTTFQDNGIQEGVILIKNYYDFIREYNLHPELKYDDAGGHWCSPTTKGLLKRTHVVASKIKPIGKETNTLQDKEEEAVIPDENNWDNTILTYEADKGDGNHYQPKIDVEQWNELLPLLRDKARPRKSWAGKLNINLDYFKHAFG